ncbi:Short-chain dehydrogenase/reductase SDR [Macleaya cordata]|uniref:Secoisolariciresinol dehydrogenase n=1 Tax=Macleaya cordata TaxID=56857 RepID=A0A200PXR0_MACCD|nr:Short-chain dehydrogenase/reductase SDR [Macleaya cordata]
MSKLRLEGKVAIITGAASGIGEAAAKLFVENGAFVVIADVQDELGNKVAASIGLEKACYKHCDVKDEKQVEETVAFALEKYGTLDIVYSNAGIMGPLPGILDLDLAAFKNTISINALGGAALIKHAGRVMSERKIRGSIVCTASVSATRGGISPVAYTASKHALLGVVRSASRELGSYGIRVNCVSPFGVPTPMAFSTGRQVKFDPMVTERNRAGTGYVKGTHLQAKNIAEAALFLASDESGCISGHDLVVDGGYTVSCDTFPIDVKLSE